MTPYEYAQKELGQKEVQGSKSNPRIVEYHSTTTLKATSDEVSWCSSFVNWCVKQAGLKGTNSAAARSWLDWGKVLDEPIEGCIVIFKRGAPPSGHVAFYVKDVSSEFIQVLGGNQKDQVKYSNYKKSDILGYRYVG